MSLSSLAIAQHGIGGTSLLIAAQGFVDAGVTPTPDITTGGGGPGWDLFRKKQNAGRKEIRKAIEMAMGLVDDTRPEVREEAKAIIAVASKEAPAKQIAQIDFAFIMESTRTIEAILVHFERLKAAKLAEDDEDEAVSMFLLH